MTVEAIPWLLFRRWYAMKNHTQWQEGIKHRCIHIYILCACGTRKHHKNIMHKLQTTGRTELCCHVQRGDNNFVCRAHICHLPSKTSSDSNLLCQPVVSPEVSSLQAVQIKHCRPILQLLSLGDLRGYKNFNIYPKMVVMMVPIPIFLYKVPTRSLILL